MKGTNLSENFIKKIIRYLQWVLSYDISKYPYFSGFSAKIHQVYKILFLQLHSEIRFTNNFRLFLPFEIDFSITWDSFHIPKSLLSFPNTHFTTAKSFLPFPYSPFTIDIINTLCDTQNPFFHLMRILLGSRILFLIPSYFFYNYNTNSLYLTSETFSVEQKPFFHSVSLPLYFKITFSIASHSFYNPKSLWLSP